MNDPYQYSGALPIAASSNGFLLALPSRFRQMRLSELLAVLDSAFLVLGPLGAVMFAYAPARRLLRLCCAWSMLAALSLMFAIYQEVVYLPLLYGKGISFGHGPIGPTLSGIGPGMYIFVGSILCLGYAWRVLARAPIPSVQNSSLPPKPFSWAQIPKGIFLWLAGAMLWIAAYMAPFWATTQCHGIIFMEPTCYGRIDPLDAWNGVFQGLDAVLPVEIALISVNMLLAEGAIVICVLNLRQLQTGAHRKLLLVWEILATILTLGAAILIARLINTIDTSTGQRWVMMPGLPLALLGLALTWVGAVWALRFARKPLSPPNAQHDYPT